jgi:hypothetical protein
MNLRIFIILGLLLLTKAYFAQAQNNGALAPSQLTTDLLEHTDKVWINGYPSNALLAQIDKLTDLYQVPEIGSKQPVLGWVVNDTRTNVLQTAYQVLVASNLKLLTKDSADVWNSGQVMSDNSVSVKYAGKELAPEHIYFWKVRTWNNGAESPFSAIKVFKTSKVLTEHNTSRYPLQKDDELPVDLKQIVSGSWFADFGKAAFGRIRITLFSDKADTLKINLGEALKDGRLDKNPGGTIRYRSMVLPVNPGLHTYIVTVAPDKRNTGPAAIKMPEYIGEVMPFRYCEIEGSDSDIQKANIVRETVHYPFNETAATFASSNKVLNDVWELCKYTIKATSFTGVYVDGDRERIPYEADALINQLCHYNVDREFSMARYSQEYLINHATWPTEWIMQSVLMAWNDYLYTGNMQSINWFCNDLKSKALIDLGNNNGLISTKMGKQTPELMKAVHYSGKELKDIVDWPQTGILGLGKNEPGETDGFVFTNFNTVVNAYHYRALILMAQIAEATGKISDANFFREKADKAKQSINQLMFDKKRGVYTDGIGTDHASLHANMFPLAFGIVPEEYRKSVMDFIRSRGMACSVYGSQFLLDAVYNANDAEYGLSLLSSIAERSWAHMIYDVGSTISLEAWDNKYKPNQDWNHAWGAAPANLIPRKLMGIEPLEPGFRKVQIKPQPGTLENAEITLPTIRGGLKVSYKNKTDELFDLKVVIPANVTAIIYIPWKSTKLALFLGKKPLKAKRTGDFLLLENIGSGEHHITCTKQ